MNKLKNKIKNMKGITLIALIITVIVLLILAGVVINMTLGNDGIIAKAQGAVDMYKNATEKEEMQLAKVDNEIDNYISSNRDYETEIAKLNAKIAQLENLNSYSTTEREIGTWIDGSKLYQKSYTVTTTDNTGPNAANYDGNNFIVSDIPTDAKEVVDVYGVFSWGDEEIGYGIQRFPVSQATYKVYNVFVWDRKVLINNPEHYKNDCVITIKYTK